MGVTIDRSEETYDGSDWTVDMKDQLNASFLGAPMDLSAAQITYFDANGNEVSEIIDAGSYTIRIELASFNPVEVTFAVLRRELTDDLVTGIQDAYDYTGSAIQPVPVVSEIVGGSEILFASDYDVTYGDNTLAGFGTVTVTGKGNYFGTVTKIFAIEARTNVTTVIDVSDVADQEYNGQPRMPKPVVTDETLGVTLVEDKDYKLIYSEDLVNVGEVTITVEGMGNYTGVLGTVNFEITPRTIQEDWITVIPEELPYIGSALEPAVIVVDGSRQLMEGKDYTLVYADNVNAGVGKITVTGKGNYTGKHTVTFTIMASGESLNVTVLPDNVVIYNGLNQVPELEVLSGSKYLVEGVDYTATYTYKGFNMGAFDADSELINAGTYVITVTGKGNYEGSIGRVSFVIKAATFEVVPPDDVNYNGREQTPFVEVYGIDTYPEDELLIEGKDYTLTYYNNVVAGIAKIRVTGKGNYAGCVVWTDFSILDGSLHVSYDGNGNTGGKVPVDSKSYLQYTRVTVLSGIPTREGAVFLGWVRDNRPASILTSQAEENVYLDILQAGDDFSIQANTALYALWAADKNSNNIPDYREQLYIVSAAGAGGTITPVGTTYVSAGSTQSYQIQVKSGYEFGTLFVDGVEVKVSTSNAPTLLIRESNGNYSYTFSNVMQSHTIIAVFQEKMESDTPSLNKDEHFSYIIGYPDGTVRPQGTVTRAEVATIFFRLLTDKSRDFYWSQENNFSDVSETDWFNNAVSTMSNAGILNGYPDGTFRPNQPVTRAEFAAIATRFHEEGRDGVSQQYFKKYFKDVDQDDWFAAAVNLAYELGWAAGYNGEYRPEDNMTRAEAVTMINRIMERAVRRGDMQDDMIWWPDCRPGDWFFEAIQEATNSHEYFRTKDKVEKPVFYYEKWIDLVDNPDWAAMERAWSEKNSAKH